MGTPAGMRRLGPEFDDFLFAPIGEEPNGMSLSVVSALARSNVDPWQEAARLARLPVQAATQRLTSLIAALPGRQIDGGAIAARLIALLPRAGATAPEPLFAGVASRMLANRSIVAFAIVWVLLLGAESIVASRPPPPRAGSTVISTHVTASAPKATPPTGE